MSPLGQILGFLSDAEITRMAGTSRENKALAKTISAAGDLFTLSVSQFTDEVYLLTINGVAKSYSKSKDFLQKQLAAKVSRLRICFPILPWPQRYVSNNVRLTLLPDEISDKKPSPSPPRISRKRKR
jgi:hypothetical protein